MVPVWPWLCPALHSASDAGPPVADANEQTADLSLIVNSSCRFSSDALIRP
jgi:hypothetical protein